MSFAAAVFIIVMSFLTAALSGVFGMAGGMVLMGILLAIMPLSAAMVLHGITQMASNGWRAVLWREHINARIVGWFALGSLLAALGFALVMAIPSKAVALLVLGLVPFLAMALPRQAQLNVARPPHAVASGAICMVLQLLAGVSGPILDLFFARAELGTREIVATKAAINTGGHFVKLVYFGHALVAGGGAISTVAILLAIAAALLGTQLSRVLLEAIDDASFRQWSQRLIAAIAVVSLLQGLILQFGS